MRVKELGELDCVTGLIREFYILAIKFASRRRQFALFDHPPPHTQHLPHQIHYNVPSLISSKVHRNLRDTQLIPCNSSNTIWLSPSVSPHLFPSLSLSLRVLKSKTTFTFWNRAENAIRMKNASDKSHIYQSITESRPNWNPELLFNDDRRQNRWIHDKDDAKWRLCFWSFCGIPRGFGIDTTNTMLSVEHIHIHAHTHDFVMARIELSTSMCMTFCVWVYVGMCRSRIVIVVDIQCAENWNTPNIHEK